MNGWTASAPGKLLIAGEYAVLEGAPAIAAAAEPRATARVTKRSSGPGELRVSHAGEYFRFELTGAGDIVWLDDPGARGRILQAALHALAKQGLRPASLGPFDVELDSTRFYAVAARDGNDDSDVPRKLGLGSSAAVAVALTTCLQHALGAAPKLQTCLLTHSEFQSGRGSGIDICASFYGGTVVRTGPKVEQLAWPGELLALPVWTGVAASTPAMLARLEKFRVRMPVAYSEQIEQLSDAATDVLEHWRAAPVQDILDALFAFAAASRQFDRVTRTGIWSEPHERLGKLAEDFGLVYKPSGAGGGDFGIAFGAQPEQVADFRLVAEKAGFSVPDFELGAPGVEVGVTA